MTASGKTTVTAFIPNTFIAAFDRLWRLPAGMESAAILTTQEFVHFRKTADDHCYAQIRGNLLDPFLLQGLRKLGLPCCFPAGSPLAATDRLETTALCYAALMSRQDNHMYLCPLDCADDIPQIEIGKASIRRFSQQEMDALLNSLPQQRLTGYVSADAASFSQFLWLVVSHEEALQADFAERYWFWNGSRDSPGTVYPYRLPHPKAVEEALFLLMLADWENWQFGEEYHWRPFDISWVYTLSDDIFRQQQPIPLVTSLTWAPSSYYDESNGWHEYDVPYSFSCSPTREQLVPFVDDLARSHLQTALACGLINLAARHQFVKAFLSSGVDEFLAHIVVIDACVGESSTNKAMAKPLKDLGPTGRLKYRLAGLLNDTSVREVIHVLYQARSNYVHGNALEKIPGLHILQARSLARRTLNAIIAEAGRAPGLTREAFLDEILQRGWNLFKVA